jgi:hypothetical protein
VTEGNTGTTNAVFTVSLSTPSALPVTVDFATAPGTATSPADFAAQTGTLTFAPGTTTQLITVAVVGEAIFEANETFVVNLTNPANATLQDGQGQGTITNDDPAPTLTISDVTVTEGSTGTTNAVFTVTLTGPTALTANVNFTTANVTAVAPADYATTSGTLTFAPGTTTQLITVAVVGDTVDEINETFNVNLSVPVNATITDPQGVGTITDDDPAPTISINDVTVSETNGGTSAVFTVALSAASGQTVTVDFATADGTATVGSDYTAAAGTLTFAAGVIAQTVIVPITGDLVFESERDVPGQPGQPGQRDARRRAGPGHDHQRRSGAGPDDQRRHGDRRQHRADHQRRLHRDLDRRDRAAGHGELRDRRQHRHRRGRRLHGDQRHLDVRTRHDEPVDHRGGPRRRGERGHGDVLRQPEPAHQRDDHRPAGPWARSPTTTPRRPSRSTTSR